MTMSQTTLQAPQLKVVIDVNELGQAKLVVKNVDKMSDSQRADAVEMDHECSIKQSDKLLHEQDVEDAELLYSTIREEEINESTMGSTTHTDQHSVVLPAWRSWTLHDSETNTEIDKMTVAKLLNRKSH